MVLAHMTWQEVEAVDREAVVVIPTGSLEQHGPHLPLFTDSILVTKVAEAVEGQLGAKMLLTPTVWLGASGHHLKFPGTLSASFDTLIGSIQSAIESLLPHGFHKFYVLNGHGGNSAPNSIAVRELKAKYPEATFGESSYYGFIEAEVAATLEGPLKKLRHACEAETSLMMHVAPALVRRDKARVDGLAPHPAVHGIVHHFDEITEEGSIGYPTLATQEKGKRLFEAAVEAVSAEIKTVADGYVLVGQPHNNASDA